MLSLNLKARYIPAYLLVILFTLFSCQKETLTEPGVDNIDTELTADSRASVDPVLVNGWQSGDAAFECAQAADITGSEACDFAWKIDEDPSGDYYTNTGDFDNLPTSFENKISIVNNGDGTFDWTSDYVVCAVIVKSATSANIYEYPDGSCGDTNLASPAINENNGQLKDISHVTFCFDDTMCGDDPNACYQDETAWADGDPYNSNGGGNWATYTPYPGDGESVDIYAGQTMFAGTVTFSDNNDGTVDIVINLEGGFIFYYDINDDEEDENIKIQDYENEPSGNPKIGKFDHKASVDAGSTSYVINVPLNNFYGIHLDVAFEVECE